MAIITKTIQPFVTPLQLPSIVDLTTKRKKSIYIKQGTATIYDDGNGHTITVPIWGYVGKKSAAAEYVGPSILVERGQTRDIRWVNAVDPTERLPFPAVITDYTASSANRIPQNVLGIESHAVASMGHACSARFSTHLHGGRVAPNADGWPESMLMPGQHALCRYENDQRATLLWYHDHAMHTTRLHAYAGMAGAWIITDAEEQRLALPASIPLVIQDRNLSVSTNGSTAPAQHLTPDALLTASGDIDPSLLFNNIHVQLLHKVEGGDGPLEFAGPLTLVNGCIWPVTDIHADWHRLRILNGANSRTFRLLLAERIDAGGGNYRYQEITAEIFQIGTDGGLLPMPVPLRELILSPAERADILVNFTPFANRDIVLLNAAEAPFANGTAIDVFARLNHQDYGPGITDPERCPDRTPYPQVMMFHVGASVSQPYDFTALNNRFATLGNTGPTSFEQATPDTTSIANTRTVAIVEKETSHGAVLVLWELQQADNLSRDHPILHTAQTVHIDGIDYYVVAERFQDPVSFMVKHGTHEIWRFINLTADTHPMHVHLVQFQGLSRHLIQHINNVNLNNSLNRGDVILQQSSQSIAGGTTIYLTMEATEQTATGLHDNERGLKDTIRVNPGEMVEVAAHFEGYCGRYVYHCHLLEHEDHDMMRQFIVTRDDLDVSHMPAPISVGRD